MTMSKWAGVLSVASAAALIVPAYVYLTGDLRTALGPWVYGLADLLYGPIWAASLIGSTSVVQARVRGGAPRRISASTAATWLAAAAMVTVACIRSANRQYHVTHPDLHLEDSTTVLVVWATLVAAVIGAGWHFWGWAMALLGTAAWATGRLPRVLSGLYVVAGFLAWFVYVLPDLEGGVLLLACVVSLWQAGYLLSARPQELAASALPAD